MSISLKNLFNNSSSNHDDKSQTTDPQLDSSLVEQPEKPVEQTPPKKVIARSPDGKFVSTKEKKVEPTILKPLEEVSPTSQPAEPVEEKTEDDQQKTSTFYGVDIRKFYTNKVWYFCLEDILLLAQYDNPQIDLSKLKENAEFKKVFDKVSESIGDTDCVSYEGFIELLPLIRNGEHMFPGPFPDWLKGISELPSTS